MVKSKNPETIAEYIKPFPKDVRSKLQDVRRVIRKVAPKAKEAIKYGIPTFVQEGNMVSFAGCKRHIGFYPAPRGDNALQKQMAPYRAETASLQFPLDKPLPVSLIRKIMQARLKEWTARKNKGYR